MGGTQTQKFSVTLTRVLRPNLFGEVRFGFSRFRSNLAQTDVGLSTAQDIGIPGINKGNDPFTDGLPQMNFDGPITSFYIGNPFANFYELEQTFQYATNWSLHKGIPHRQVGRGLAASCQFAENRQILSWVIQFQSFRHSER